MVFFAFISCLITAISISWFRFFQAATNPGLLFLPLESYFFTASFDKTTELYNRPDFFISYFDYKPPGSERLINEVFIWIFCILVILLFLQIMSCHEWFTWSKASKTKLALRDERNDKNVVFKSSKHQQGVPVLGKIFKRLSASLQSKSNIFNLDFRQITLISFSFGAIFLFMIPNDSSDMYGYLARGAQQISYGLNPYHHTVSEIANWWDQPLLANINSIWSYNPAPYGPLYMLIYAGIAFLSMGNFYIAMFLFKLFNLGIFACLLLLMVRILNDKEIDKEYFEKKFNDARQIFSYKKIIYSLIALNPFIMVEVLLNGHNDILMGFLILLSLYLCFKNQVNLALITLTCSILSKYLSVAILPLMLIYFVSRGAKNFPWIGSLISSGLIYLAWIYYDPFSIHFNKMSNNVLLCHKSLQKTFNSFYKLVIGESMPATANLIFLGIFICCLVFLCYKFTKTENQRLSIFHFSFLAMFLLIFVFSAKFYSWYLIMILPFGALIHPRFMLMLSLSHMLSLTFLDQANIANFVVMTALPSVIYFKYLLKQDL